MGKRIGGYLGLGVTDLSSSTNSGGATGIWNVIHQNFYRIKNEWPYYGSVIVTGGNIANALAPGNGSKYHTFTTPGTLSVDNAPKTVDILVVAGGGSGGTGYYGGGGGAGGLIYYPNFVIPVGSHQVTVGLGGTASTASNGGPSTFGTSADPSTHLVALGGGYGGPRSSDASPGGSGGGVGLPWSVAAAGIQKTDPSIPAISRTYGYGNAGGTPAYGAGGGGAGGAGQPGDDGDGGIGYVNASFDGPLIGIPALDPYNGAFAGGGGGGLYPTSPGVGGSGVGGDGGTPASPDGKNAVANTGSGGGGGYTSGAPGGAGAGGIVIIKYLV